VLAAHFSPVFGFIARGGRQAPQQASGQQNPSKHSGAPYNYNYLVNKSIGKEWWVV
jgi:hypothetical protein